MQKEDASGLFGDSLRAHANGAERREPIATTETVTRSTIAEGTSSSCAGAATSGSIVLPDNIKPYYSEGGIVILHGDCREILPHLRADVLVSDPPYGIGYRTSSSRSMSAVARDWPDVVGDDEPFDPEHLLALSLPSVLWGGNHYGDALPPSPSWLVWFKRDYGVQNDSADAELAWTNLGGPARVYHHPWMGMLRASERGEAYHPTQKPVALMAWVLAQCPEGVVLDPYMGGGSTLRAAKDMGRRAIGIEIEERYCEIAAKRLAQGVFSFE